MIPFHNAMGIVSVGGFDPDAAAYIAAMTVAPDATRQALINAFFIGIKADGLWDKADAFWLMAAHDAQAARLNARQPAAYTLAPNGTLTFTPDRGYQGDGGSDIATGFNPVSASAWSQNSASLSAYVNATPSDAQSGVAIIGDAAGRVLLSPWTSLGLVSRLNASNSTPAFAGVSTRLGMSTVSRTAATVSNAQKNGATIGATSDRASAAVASSSVSLLSYAGGNFSLDRLAFAWIGGGLTDAEMTALYNRVLAYLSPIGGN